MAEKYKSIPVFQPLNTLSFCQKHFYSRRFYRTKIKVNIKRKLQAKSIEKIQIFTSSSLDATFFKK